MDIVAPTNKPAKSATATVAKPRVHPVAEFQDVVKVFPVQIEMPDVTVLKSVSFTIPEGSFTMLHGPSGSGKSTILNTLIGLEPPTSGKVCVAGTDLYAQSSDERASFRARTIGMVHQDNYWVNSLSVAENVALPLLLSGWAKQKALFLAKQSIARVGLEEFANYNPTVLSGGQQQRVSFARATVIRPRILVADEPTGNLDSVNGDRIIELLQDFNKSYGATVVLVTHNDELLSNSDNIIEVKDGEVTEVGAFKSAGAKK